ncbi:unnamed protein product, partial [Mesorhabditis spiculigera]
MVLQRYVNTMRGYRSLGRPERRNMDGDPMRSARHITPPRDIHYKRILLTRRFKDHNIYNDLGLRIVGGKRMDNNELGAFVSAVDSSRRAQTLGEVKEGDRVMEWNGVLLTGRTFEEVERIVNASRGEVELIIKTPCTVNCNHGQQQPYEKERLYEAVPHRDHSPEAAPPVPTHKSTNGRVNGLNNNNVQTTPQFPLELPWNEGTAVQMHQQLPHALPPLPSQQMQQQHQQVHHQQYMPLNRHGQGQHVQQGQQMMDNLGHLEVALEYERATSRLIVRILSARGLPMRDGQRANPLPNPFVKIYLLPGRKVSHKRRTRFVPSSTEPEWNQIVEYDVPSTALHAHYLEFSLWDYDRFTENNTMGQVVISMAERGILSGQPRWYPLQPCERTSFSRHQMNIPVDRVRMASHQPSYQYNPTVLDIGYPAIS